MKFIVFGASGFIGRHVFDYMRCQGYPALGTQSTKEFSDLIKFNMLENSVEESIPTEFLKKTEPTFAVICLKFGPIDLYPRQKELSRFLEVERTKLIIKELVRLKITPVYLGSSYVFDGGLGYYSEESLHNPINTYGQYKSEIETFLLENQETSLILRLDKNVGDDPSESHDLSTWYKCMKRNQEIHCIQDQIFSPTYVGDVARGVFQGCKYGLKGVYNLANTEYFSRVELVEQFALSLDMKAKIVAKPQSDFDFLDPRPLKSYLDSTKFIEATGVRFTSMREVFQQFAIKLDSLSKL